MDKVMEVLVCCFSINESIFFEQTPDLLCVGFDVTSSFFYEK
jgi:hypothetical protein